VAVGTVLPTAGPYPDQATIAEITQAALAASAPVALGTEEAADRLASSSTYYAASMAVLFLFFAAQFGVVSIHAERRAGTLARMLAAPVSSRAILAGKVLVSIVLGAVSVGVVAVGTTLLMNASWGDPVAVAVLILAVVLAASGIALLAVGFTRNEDQASGLTAIIAMVLAVLGGSFYPLSQAPEALAQVSLVTPHAWFLRGIDDLASGGGITVVLPSIAVLAAIGIVTGGIGLIRARTLVAAR
jgi:ABC-2 type transport system permease protein